jgi:YjbE family integral membrane protein
VTEFALLVPIIWIDLLLSGDNAVVIALVCRELPKHQQRIGMVLGTGAAIVLRVVMALAASFLMGIEGLRILGGLFVLWVAFGLLKDEIDEENNHKIPASLMGAIATIGIADASMSLDNVFAIVALAKGVTWLIVCGILFSIPIMIAGAAIIKTVVDRYHWIVWFGAILLAWVAGSIIVDDPLLIGLSIPTYLIEICACGVVLCAGAWYNLPKLTVN